eukprot:Trichotokara_eunicae@DN4612_c0_g1_i1.p1
MSSKTNLHIKKLLEAEEESDLIIRKARDNRINKLKEAKNAADEEVENFRVKEEQKFQAENVSEGDESKFNAELDEKTKHDLEVLQKQFKSNKEKVATFMIDRVSQVDLTLPEVVKRTLKMAAASK